LRESTTSSDADAIIDSSGAEGTLPGSPARIAVNQVAVSMGFTLTASNGRMISDVGANSASYAGANVSQMALTLVNEQADEVVAKLYGDYCRSAGFPPPPRAKKQ